MVKAGRPVPLTVSMSPGKASDLAIEYRVETAGKPGMPATRPLMAAGVEHSANLPAQAASSIVRYRIVGKRLGANVERISPRATDPFEWHAYAVSPDLPATRTYQMAIAPEDWTALWTNLTHEGTLGPNEGCALNPNWDKRHRATFVADGKVYDVLVRYTGSRHQRKNGVNLPMWTAPGPAQPTPLKVFSWRVSFPRWGEFDGRRTINLNKQYQACPGVLNALEGRLFWEAGVATNNFRFARLHISAYYNHMMEVENIDEAFIGKHVEKTGGAVGDLFKLDGSIDDQGSWYRADFNPLAANRSCPAFTVLDRYRFTYERQSNDWREADPKGHDELIAMIDELARIKAGATASESPAVRAFFEKHFDVNQLITHWAVRNFVGVWDDGVHNYYLYKRSSDGKWVLYPQDFDLDFGGDAVDAEWKGFANPPTLSFFHGEQGSGKTAGGLNQLKIQIIRAFRKEFAARVQELGKTVLSEANILRHLDEVSKEFSVKDWMEAPARRCDLSARVAMARQWLKDRHAFLAGGVR